jgi:hypothetical protein
MQNDGQWVFSRSGGMIGKGLEQKSHLPALAVPDETRQPNAVAEIMQFDRDFGIHKHGGNLAMGKFDQHALNAEIENATLTNRALPPTNGNRKYLFGHD